MNSLVRSVFFALAAHGIGTALRAEPAPQGPSAELVSWVREHAVTLSAVEAGNGFADLEPLRTLVGNSRIIALGEPTHGSREIFQLKHRLVEYFTSELGFSVFALEANMPEARKVNEYVAYGRGNSSDAVRGLGEWTWSTEEVRAMVEWMRRYNADGAGIPGGHRIEFAGFDIQSPLSSASIVRDFTSTHDQAYLPEVDRAIAALKADGNDSVGFANGSFPVDIARGHHLVFSGWIKTKDLSQGGAGFWCSAGTDRPGPPG